MYLHHYLFTCINRVKLFSFIVSFMAFYYKLIFSMIICAPPSMRTETLFYLLVFTQCLAHNRHAVPICGMNKWSIRVSAFLKCSRYLGQVNFFSSCRFLSLEWISGGWRLLFENFMFDERDNGWIIWPSNFPSGDSWKKFFCGPNDGRSLCQITSTLLWKISILWIS